MQDLSVTKRGIMNEEDESVDRNSLSPSVTLFSTPEIESLHVQNSCVSITPLLSQSLSYRRPSVLQLVT